MGDVPEEMLESKDDNLTVKKNNLFIVRWVDSKPVHPVQREIAHILIRIVYAIK